MVMRAQAQGIARATIPNYRGGAGRDVQPVLLHPPHWHGTDVDDEACIQTLTNIVYRTIYSEGALTMVSVVREFVGLPSPTGDLGLQPAPSLPRLVHHAAGANQRWR